MTNTQYNNYKKLKQRRESIRLQLINLKSKSTSSGNPLIKEGWLELTYGNGSFGVGICDNKNTMELIEKLLIKEQNKEIVEITKQMDKL